MYKIALLHNRLARKSLSRLEYKKRSYCCDSRSYCVQYFNAIRCEHISTSEEKSVCCQSANAINNYCGSASANSQSAHLSARALHCSRHSAVSAHASAVAPNGTVPTRSRRNALLCIRSQVAVRFLWCILWLNDTSYSKGVKRDE